jgi:Mg2+ and Co2+ transporter CorA
MRWIAVTATRATTLDAAPAALPAEGFLWLDVLHAEVIADPEVLRGAVERIAGVRIFDLHMQDAANLQHPSYFDATNEYDMLIFRKLAMAEAPPLEERPAKADERRTLQEILTRPITFFLFDRLLVTVRQEASRTIELVYSRLMDAGSRTSPASPLDKSRLPTRPGELMLRMLNQMVDRYLELREPLSERLDRWQRELIDPRRPFSNWTALLEARIELRRLENLSEGQYDALTELRDAYLEETAEPSVSDAYMVRLNDVMEHIQRVLHHARRLQAALESAVQLHFSATTHQTNLVVRTLTAIAAIFAPLTLITGVFGMNFDRMPWIDQVHGFWWAIGAMAAVAVTLLLYFWARRIIDRPRTPRPPRWLR